MKTQDIVSIDEFRDISITRSKRRSIQLSITPENGIKVRAPYFYTDAEIEEFVRRKSDWLRKYIARNKSLSQVEKLTEEELNKLAKKALETLPTKVQHYAKQIGVTYGRITIRNQKTRWGSCSSKGNLNFNCLLMLAPEYVQDYIVVHELCHRKQMNHSQAFWLEVKRIMPDYQEAELWLKKQGQLLMRKNPR